MANDSPQSVVARVRAASYAAELTALCGANGDSVAAFNTILEAFEAWEQDDREFYPYTSKYDAWLAGTALLSKAERRGFDCSPIPAKETVHDAMWPPGVRTERLLNSPTMDSSRSGCRADAQIPANANPAWFDLGLCGPERLDLQSRAEYCGRFMTPSLRNVATRKAFFHNGVFHTLQEVIEFYCQRDTDPGKWYPRNHDGSVKKFDDLPPRYHGNVETGFPFGRSVGVKPALSNDEVRLDRVFENVDGWFSRRPLSADRA